MKHGIAPLVRHRLAAALFVATMLPGVAFAQTSKEKALEARIAEREREVHMLVSAQRQQQGQIAQTQTQVTEVRTLQAHMPPAPAVPARKKPIQLTSNPPKPVPGTRSLTGGSSRPHSLPRAPTAAPCRQGLGGGTRTYRPGP
ncbi:hypothetical protein, partial [Acinetobacter baumannii]|uniref:hypothetical protein n=1 Tax=Acinetobacter baumannii TaxID=470 RepID=UPI001EF15F39